ncbi:hypothetical protein DL96DRAFT_1091688 [Flagelloscypha sp. PMI_526]|nr:hypothetical protein DL96DRAFT_1091688 [Flagelloscypha sp. PMI_526]
MRKNPLILVQYSDFLCRTRWSSTPSRSLKNLFIIVLAQLISVTLQFASSIANKLLFFKDTHFLIIDGNIQKLPDASVREARVGLVVCQVFSGVAVVGLANTVLVWRAYTLYPDLSWIRSILIFAWVVDVVFAMLHAAATMSIPILWFKGISSDYSDHLQRIAQYTSYWISFALNMLVTLLIAYRAWKFKNSSNTAGLSLKKSTVYNILARLVETGILLLAVQLLIAVLATTYTSGEPADPGYIASDVLLQLTGIVIHAHPAAMSLVSADIVSKEDRVSGDVEVIGVSKTLSFRIADSARLTEPPRSTVSSDRTEN